LASKTDKNDTDKVTALITAESIIAGFMIAYGALVGQNLLYWSEPKHQGSLFTTYFAGILIYAIVLTCFVSILLLFKSLDANEKDGVRYKAGYRLFSLAIVVSCVYVVLNVGSIYHFTVSTDHKPLEVTLLGLGDKEAATWLVTAFLVYAVILFDVFLLAIMRHPNAMKIVILSLIEGVVVTLLTGLLLNMPAPLLGAEQYGYPLPWLFRLILAPEYFPWRVDLTDLLGDVAIWAMIVGVALFAWTKIKL
jgi:hypothetical protein